MSRLVFVTMEYEGDEFVVRIVGDEEISEGFDNYQEEENLSALKKELVCRNDNLYERL